MTAHDPSPWGIRAWHWAEKAAAAAMGVAGPGMAAGKWAGAGAGVGARAGTTVLRLWAPPSASSGTTTQTR